MVVDVRNYTKKLKGRNVLDGVSYKFEGGKIYGIQGKNGCGKTMLMRSIAGLVISTRGSIIINGKVLHRDISIPESIGVLIENPSFLPRYSGYENLKMLAMLDDKVSDGEIKDLLEKVGLKDAADKKFGKYSLGMKQRLGIAAAIMGSPEIVLLDEPINAIDGEGVEQIRQLILGLRDENRVVLVACHDKEEMQLLADDIICMQQGRIVEKG